MDKVRTGKKIVSTSPRQLRKRACSQRAGTRPVDPNRYTRAFAAIVKATGLPHLTLHGLRHAHSTIMLVEGFNPKIVSERLGHATIATTMDIYSHVLPDLQEQAAMAVAAKLSRK